MSPSRVSKPPMNGSVVTSTRTSPQTTGIRAAPIWPSSFGSAGRSKTSSTTPSAVIAVAPTQDRPASPLSQGSQIRPAPKYADQDREPAQLRRRDVVQPALGRLVDGPDPAGYRLGRRDQHPGGGGREDESQERVLGVEGAHRPDSPEARGAMSYEAAESAASTSSCGSRGLNGPVPASRFTSSIAPGSRQLAQPAFGDQLLVNGAHGAAEDRVDGRAQRHRLAVHGAAGAHHQVGVGDQALGVDGAAGNHQGGHAALAQPARLALGARDHHRDRVGRPRAGRSPLRTAGSRRGTPRSRAAGRTTTSTGSSRRRRDPSSVEPDSARTAGSGRKSAR